MPKRKFGSNFDQDNFDSVRVVDVETAIKIVGLSRHTWMRLSKRGELPVQTRLSEYRVGYRISDIRAWLDARRNAEPIVPAAMRRRKSKSSEETVTP